jgi:hypothetical protein
VPTLAAVPVLVALVLAIAGPLGPPLAATGRFLDFYAGVFALVSLSVAVMVGLLATDRWVLASRHRVRAQALHRAAAGTAVMMLAVHIVSQVLRGRVGVLDVLVPMAGLKYGLSIGLGTIACYLLILAFGTGVARGWFAASAHPWVWRVLHCAAYAAWPLAIAHGLTAGRTPADWVISSYGLCLAAVVFAAAVRFLPRARPGRPR